MSAPLYESLLAYCPRARLHTPGHKGRMGGVFEQIARIDVTELSATDDLYHPTGCLAQAEQAASDFFGSWHTFFSAGGATLCIQTALSLFFGKKILMDRNSHVSAFHAVSALDICPEFLYNAVDVVPQPISAEQVERACRKYPSAAAVYITSPNYYGLCADLRAIRAVCKRYQKKLIVDHAHGTHLYLTNPQSSAQAHADIVIDSAHKTLPVLTGGAYLHVNMESDILDIKEKMRYFGSTSPSFPILASLDFCREWLQTEGREAFREAVVRVEALRQQLLRSQIRLIQGPIEDPMRICIRTRDGHGLAEYLEENGIYPEMATQGTVVLLFSPMDTEDVFAAVGAFFEQIPFRILDADAVSAPPRLPRRRSYRSAFWSEAEPVKMSDSVGRTCARDVLPYPPGVPVVLCGEQITQDAARYLSENGVKTVFVCK